jgi:uncharacterized protein
MTDERAPSSGKGRTITVRVFDRLLDLPGEAWNACAHGPAKGLECDSETTRTDQRNPFVLHEFLCALEESDAVSVNRGWLPQHLVVENSDGVIAAVMPCYLKSHSSGEYVFDHGWADAFERAGGQYYPKLQVSVPFTPVTGPRLMTRDGDETHRRALVAGAIELCQRLDASSVHWTFLGEADSLLLDAQGMLSRTDQQFHWNNAGYAKFDDFLASLASRKRKAIRRERREAIESGIEIVRLRGAEITESHWDAFYGFYLDTGSRKWGQPYLNRRFFSLIGQAMSDRILLVMARRAGHWIAGALNFIGDDALYGRNWGCIEDHPFLHFEVCYYQAIEHAIETGLARVEAGAQGAHKLARGYLPVTTRSAHYIGHPGLRRAIADYLSNERRYVEQEMRILRQHAPFRKGT